MSETDYGSYIHTPPQMMQPEKASIVEMQLDVNTLITHLKADLLGMKWDVQNKKFIDNANSKAVINENGANKLIAPLKTILEHPVILGYLSENEVRDLARSYELAASTQITINAEEWDVKKVSDLDTFIDSTGTLVYCNFTRAVKGHTHQGIVTISQLREIQSQIQREKEVTARGYGSIKDRVRNALA